MKILIAPDKFKGSLSAAAVCSAIENGLNKRKEPIEIILHPMADGGDGTLEIVSKHLNLERQLVQTVDPIGRSILAEYATSSNAAFIELASASGLVLLKKHEQNPLKVSSFGTGLLFVDALKKGYKHIYLFLGGSATNDAGIGIATALGYSFLDKNKALLKPIGKNLVHIEYIESSSAFSLEDVKITLLCDVKNTLYGTGGAAYTFGAQKGANVKHIQYLDKGLKKFSQIIKDQIGVDVSTLQGGGSAGGIGAGLVALFGAELKEGFEVVSTLTNLESKIQQADLVISGEGKLDYQSLQGKVVDGIAKLCLKNQKPLVALVGKNDLPEHQISILNIRQVLSISEIARNTEDAMQYGAAYLEEIALKSLILKPMEMSSIFNSVEQSLIQNGYTFERKDPSRPWGGFWVIEESQTAKFAKQYFPNYAIDDLTKGLKVSPKILLVAPNKRLSWQYHHRRSEIWKVVQGTVGVVKSNTDKEMPLAEYSVGDIIVLKREERHRLVGLNEWSIIAEIWQHTDPAKPSDENDIVRLQDDFNRTTPPRSIP